MKTLKLLLLSLTIMTAFNACKKDDDSDYQPKGNYGNANITSDTYTANWIFQGGNEWDATLYVPAITTSILSTGSINTYLSGDGGQSWIVLPVYLSSVTMAVVYQVSTVNIGAFGGSSAPSGTLFKVVIVSSAGMIAHPNLDYNNYEEVRTTFNLKN